MSNPVGRKHVVPIRYPQVEPLRPEALELVSDLLLERAGRDDEYPAYSEEYLIHKAARSRKGGGLGWSTYTCTDLLLSAEVDDLSRSARLADDEDTAWRMCLEGRPPDEIAETLGTTRTRAVRLAKSARHRVASCGSKLKGLHSVYLSLIHRCRYRPVQDQD